MIMDHNVLAPMFALDIAEVLLRDRETTSPFNLQFPVKKTLSKVSSAGLGESPVE